ncbi:hypothetical protein PUP75_06120 [Pseudomonas chlororaphis]|uniref:hypothetical protein n=1 Tax=Pseudomonas chlororaphis TaxID=587753 RepID=UPI00236803A1|nr:hypothetical protein [Pseudomonas chlororaphis]WDH54363.1 hypothetical protein PUP75_06120 [Pseudomonas chlororaphis]
MIYKLPPLIILILTGCPILLALISLLSNYYLSRRYLEKMLDALKGSSYFAGWVTYLPYLEWHPRYLMFAKLRGMLFWPEPGIRKGIISPYDVRNFPPQYKRLLKAQNFLDGVIIVWGALVYLLIKL